MVEFCCSIVFSNYFCFLDVYLLNSMALLKLSFDLKSFFRELSSSYVVSLSELLLFLDLTFGTLSKDLLLCNMCEGRTYV